MNILRTIPLVAIALGAAACASPDVHSMRGDPARHACAAVGFAPGGDRFGQCVADLDSNIAQSHPDHD
jgi:hypothetical protein